MNNMYTRQLVDVTKKTKDPITLLEHTKNRKSNMIFSRQREIIKKSPKIDVLVCTPDESTQRFKKFIHSFKLTTKGIEYNLIIRNNHWDKNFCVIDEFNNALDNASEWLLILDDDVYFEDNNWLKKMIECTHIKDVHVIGTDVWYNKNVHSGCGVVIDYNCNPIFLKRNDKTRYVPAIGTCIALVKKTSLRFSKEYKHYFIDPDFCLRGWEKGLKTVVVPVKTYHECDGEIMKKAGKSVSTQVQEDKEIFKKIWIDTDRLSNLYSNIKKDVDCELPNKTNIVVDDKIKYHVNFVTPNGYNGAIGELLRSIVENHPEHVSVSINKEKIDEFNTLNYYVVWHIIKNNNKAHYSKKALDVLFCPHPDDRTCYPTLKGASHNTFMCTKYYQEAIKNGVEKDKCTLIYPGIDGMFFDRRLRLFHPAWTQGRGKRKGAEIWEKLKDIEWLNCIGSEGEMSKQELLLNFHAADVIGCFATIEGGPMMLAEAYSIGKPIIIGDNIGLIEDFKNKGFIDNKRIITYYPINLETVLPILRQFYDKKIKSLPNIDWLSHNEYAKNNWKLFDKLMLNK